MSEGVTKISFEDFDQLPRTANEFNPGIFDVTGLGRMYQDGRMYATVDIEEEQGTRTLEIYTWDCDFRGKGYSGIALKWFREHFEKVVVYGAGDVDEDGVGDVATGHWLHMLEKGLVDAVFLDDGRELLPDAEKETGMSFS